MGLRSKAPAVAREEPTKSKGSKGLGSKVRGSKQGLGDVLGD